MSKLIIKETNLRTLSVLVEAVSIAGRGPAGHRAVDAVAMRTKKIFVGGLSATTSLEDVQAYFEQFSEVRDAMVAYDRVTNRQGCESLRPILLKCI